MGFASFATPQALEMEHDYPGYGWEGPEVESYLTYAVREFIIPGAVFFGLVYWAVKNLLLPVVRDGIRVTRAPQPEEAREPNAIKEAVADHGRE